MNHDENSPVPAASVIIVASAGRESIEKILRRLKLQSVAKTLEIIISAHANAVGEIAASPVEGFHSFKVIAADLSSSARARAAAFHLTKSPIIILCEDHCFPIGRQWAQLIIEAHNSNYSGVGPVMRNANPNTALSWANLVIEYGPWLYREGAIVSKTIPGHNSSYKREVLASYDEKLSDMLEAEWIMQNQLSDEGHQFLIDPRIIVEHINFSRFYESVRLRLFAGWMFGASRSVAWGRLRRLLYATSFPAIAVVRLARLMGQFYKCPDARPHMFRCLPIASVLLLLDALGEAVGYAFGDLGHRGSLAELEYNRSQNVIQSEVFLCYQ